MIDLIASKEVQRFIRENEHIDEKSLVLQKSVLFGIPSSVLADQIRGKRKAKEKLPLLYSTHSIVFPHGINLEQCSSEKTGRHKASIITQYLTDDQRNKCADLTGGFGIDTLFLSEVFKQIDYIEPEKELLNIARHNHEKLGKSNISYHHQTAELFLQLAKDSFDFIFIDPSRRASGNKKVFRFSDCEPDVVELLPVLLSKSKFLLIKASPLIDIHAGLTDLQNVISVDVVSIDNECKEVLFMCAHKAPDEPLIRAVNIQSDTVQNFSFTRTLEKMAEVKFSEPRTYIYEPNASILKSGAFKVVSSTFKLSRLHPNTHLYTSEEIQEDFPGRIFTILSEVKPDIKSVKPFFPDSKGNVITRNYPLSAEALRKKVRLKDGGNKYLIACSSKNKKHVMVAERLK